MTTLNKNMNTIKTNRRAFFVRSSAAVGAGLAATSAAASGLMFDASLPLKEQVAHLQHQLTLLEDREAIRQLQLAYTTLVEKQAYTAVAELFTPDAKISQGDTRFRDKQAELFFAAVDQAHNSEVRQTALRLDDPLQQDCIAIGADGQHADAVFHCQVEISVPHTDNSSLADMARLQGQYASSRWIKGKFNMAYRKVGGQWKISRLEFQA